MGTLHELYRIREDNLTARRQFIGMRSEDVSALRRLRGWSEKAIPKIVTAFYDHQFAFPPTAEFFRGYAQRRGTTAEEQRHGLESAQRSYLGAIFEEAAGDGTFGVEFFEKRLHVGRVHNAIDLPLKWYLGSYMKWFDLTTRSHR
jgi:hypothetical protein